MPVVRSHGAAEAHFAGPAQPMWVQKGQPVEPSGAEEGELRLGECASLVADEVTADR